MCSTSQVTLDLWHYNQQNDSILKVITENKCQPEYTITVDLPDTSRASTDLRPDLVVWSDSRRVLVFAELTEMRHNRKVVVELLK